MQLLRLPASRVINHGLNETLPEARPAIAELLAQFAREGLPGRPIKLPLTKPGDSADQVSYWDLLAVPMAWESGQLVGVLVVVEVTDRVKRERRQAEEIARLSGLVKLKGDLINMVSHELRTPLTTIAGYAEFLEDNVGGQLTDDQRGYVSQIQQAEGRIHHIVDDLLDCARIEAGTLALTLEDLDLGHLVCEVISSLMPQSQAAMVHPALRDSGKALWVRADRKRTGQVLANLLGNAIKFTPAGGSLIVTLTRQAEQVKVTIADSGNGLDAEQLGHLFEPFYQARPAQDSPHGGAGLGLAISKQLVESQGGRIGATSVAGRGSEFWFTLPLAKASNSLGGGS